MDLEDLTTDAIEAEIEAKKTEKARAAQAKIQAKQKEQAVAQASQRDKKAAEEEAAKRKEAEQQQQDAEKTRLLDRIEAYRKRFPELKKRNNISHRSALSDIQDEVHYIETQLGSSKSGEGNEVGRRALVLCMHGVETVATQYWNPLGLKLNGLTRVASDNMSELGPLIDELFIKYGADLSVSVETRLLMSVAVMVYTVHSANARVGPIDRPFEPPQGSSDL